MEADPDFYDIVYVGGQSQLIGDSLQAKRYTGLLFRGNITSNSWQPLTLMGTKSRSAPHADGRSLVWDPITGGLFYTCDGGVYFRSEPRGNSGDWFERNGDLAISEYYSASYNTLTGVVVAGAQDNGSFLSNLESRLSFVPQMGDLFGSVISLGDGAATWIDLESGIMLSSSQHLGLYSLSSTLTPFKRISFAGTALENNQAPFFPKIVSNAVSSNTPMFMTCISSPISGCFTVDLSNMVAPDVKRAIPEFHDSVVFGGVKDSMPDANVILAVSQTDVTVRSSLMNLTSRTPPNWGVCADLAANPTNYFEAIAVCSTLTGSKVWLTSDFANSWSDITGNLYAVSGSRTSVGALSALVIVLADGTPVYLVGTLKGVFASFPSAPSVWTRLGSFDEMPVVPVMQLRYYQQPRDLLLAATLGRAVWSIQEVTILLYELRIQACPRSRPLTPPRFLTPNDCVLSDWSAPTPCSRSCGGGVSIQTRYVVEQPSNGGALCPPLLPKVSVCNPDACASTKMSNILILHFK